MPDISWLLSLVLSASLMMGCGNLNSKKETSENADTEQIAENTSVDASNNGVKAPDIKADASGLIGLQQCPTENDRLRVEISENLDVAKIFLDGELLQTITDSEDQLVAADGEAPIHFMDANFDGLTDIFIGPGESRTYSTLLLWDSASKQFQRVGKLGMPSLQNILLCPEIKSVFEGGSNSWCASSATRSVWENGNLKMLEELTMVTDPEQYGEYDVSDKYTLRSSDGTIQKSTGDVSQLPDKWEDVLESIGY